MKKILVIVVLVVLTIVVGFTFYINSYQENKYVKKEVLEEQQMISKNDIKRIEKGIYYDLCDELFLSISNSDVRTFDCKSMEIKISFDFKQSKVKYVYSTLNSKKYFYQYFEGEYNDRMEFQIADTAMGTMLFYCTGSTAHGYEKIYPLSFNLETGEIEDLFEGVDVDGYALLEYDTIRKLCIGKNKMVATIGKNGVENTIIIDRENQKVVKLKDIFQFDVVSNYELTDDSIIVEREGEIWKYDFVLNKINVLCRNVKKLEGLEKATDGLFMDSRDVRYALVCKKNNLYILDYEKESMIQADDIKGEYGAYEINSERKEVVFTEFTDKRINIKILDLETGKFRIHEINNGEEGYSKGFIDAVWGNDDNLILEYYREESDGKDSYRVYRLV